MISKEKIEDVAKAQPMSYFKKFESITLHNLRVFQKQADRERNRTDGNYSMTAEVIEATLVKHAREALNLVRRVIRTKKRMNNAS